MNIKYISHAIFYFIYALVISTLWFPYFTHWIGYGDNAFFIERSLILFFSMIIWFLYGWFFIDEINAGFILSQVVTTAMLFVCFFLVIANIDFFQSIIEQSTEDPIVYVTRNVFIFIVAITEPLSIFIYSLAFSKFKLLIEFCAFIPSFIFFLGIKIRKTFTSLSSTH